METADRTRRRLGANGGMASFAVPLLLILTMSAHRPVILFREPARDACATNLPDSYRFLLSSAGYRPLFVPVLAQTFERVDELVDVVAAGPSRWSGVVGTSKRAGEAWCNAVAAHARNELERSGGKGKSGGPLAHDWSVVPLFVPGRATAEAFASSKIPEEYHLQPQPGTEDTGSAAALAPFILDALGGTATKPLLLLEGDKTLPTLTEELRDRIPLHHQLVYRTETDPQLESSLQQIVGLLESESSAPSSQIWLVFFSPSSSRPVSDALRRLGKMKMEAGGVSFDARLVFDIAAIGKTTAEDLVGMGLPPKATASTPTAKGILDALLQADGRPATAPKH